MIVKPVVIQGTVQNSQNMTSIKHAENTKPYVEQANIAATTHKEVQHKSENVIRKDNINKEQKKFDAKDKGANEYVSVKVKKKVNDKGEESVEEQVLVKSQGGFDIKI
ncbi:MAG: hypothetical protein IJD58_09510 [Lachnospiraceae bacterium]|nr:hypothetical protein [Lachnospiraceae bacterium]